MPQAGDLATNAACFRRNPRAIRLSVRTERTASNLSRVRRVSSPGGGIDRHRIDPRHLEEWLVAGSSAGRRAESSGLDEVPEELEAGDLLPPRSDRRRDLTFLVVLDPVGLRDDRSGFALTEPCFDERPEPFLNGLANAKRVEMDNPSVWTTAISAAGTPHRRIPAWT